ncbi:hypothetical protein NPIL_3551 [Nephila pilipes]|uniref:Uncharacterized protein n=1 Tax=Nephila pilipes TaxID=299642 RepID=A0A8X6U835_NEPPI|nr:hypothetical protein NPIL_3551 [Nephila pilipes]
MKFTATANNGFPQSRTTVNNNCLYQPDVVISNPDGVHNTILVESRSDKLHKLNCKSVHADYEYTTSPSVYSSANNSFHPRPPPAQLTRLQTIPSNSTQLSSFGVQHPPAQQPPRKNNSIPGPRRLRSLFRPVRSPVKQPPLNPSILSACAARSPAKTTQLDLHAVCRSTCVAARLRSSSPPLAAESGFLF